MADIKRTCTKCGMAVTVSEYAEERLPCPHCGMALGGKAPLKLGVVPPPLAIPETRPCLPPPPAPAVLTVAQHRAARAHGRAPAGRQLWWRGLVGWIFFAGLLAALLAWQWQGQRDAHYLQAYLTARWGLVAVAWLAVLVAAFRDTWLQGVLCLCVPPYTFYYALNRLDYFTVRALYFAVVLALAAEFYFMPGTTLVGTVQTQINTWVVAIRELIERAGRHLDAI